MKYSTLTLIKRVFEHAKKYWLHISGILLLSVFSAPIALLGPLPLKLLVDNAFGDHLMPQFIRFFFPGGYTFTFNTNIIIVAVLVIVVELLVQLHALANWILVTYTGEKIVLSFKTKLFNQVQRLSLAYHDKIGTADSLYRIQFDSNAIRTLVVSGIAPIISASFTIIGMLYVITLIEWHFTIIAIGVIPILMYLTQVSSTKLKYQWTEVKKQESSAMSVLQETLFALRVVKAFSGENFQEEKFVRKSDRVLKSQIKVAYTSASFDLVIGIILSVATALFIYLGATYVHRERISLGELIVVLAYLVKVFGPLQTLNKHFNNLQSSLVSVERAYKIIDKERDVFETPHSIPINKISGNIVFNNVYFGYEKGTPTLQNISFEVKQGQRVGIMGKTGSGKTSLINLLTRLYEPTDGSIVVDGRDIREYKVSDYRSQFSIVLQEPVLFSTSFEENIAYGKPEAAKKEIVRAAIDAHAYDFISMLPNGYQTEVGERGMQLSGGERQRISIARAFLKNSPILILDEPTSSVDVATESLIMEATNKLMKGKTTFLITHRLETLNECDIIIHLEKGKLVDFIDNNNREVFEQKMLSFRASAI